ncbi:MAG: M23 family metallopeptidase [Pseudoflavonifractor sp.]|nr:M23 family metallopeptidase [Pseudoflavonifractor sp.]
MSKKVFYRYNQATDQYDRVYPSTRDRVVIVARHFAVGLALGMLFFLITYYYIDFPKEKLLRQENEQLLTEFNLLNERLDRSLAVMEDIAGRDDNFYRVMMGADRISASRRYAGLDNKSRYRHLDRLNDAELVRDISRKVDILDRSIYIQTKSFDELVTLAGNSQDRLSHIPSISPISELDLRQMASGYGVRVDPVYGTTKFHEGMDFASDIGTPVYATGDGNVTDAEWNSGYGNMVAIDHGYNYTTRYAHLSKILVKAGQAVKRGDLIGEVGNTGKSTGPHLHYEVRFDGKPQNPVNYYFRDLTPAQYDELIAAAENAGHVMD